MTNAEKSLEQVSETLKDLLEGLQYGSITIIVQDGKIIQLEKNEKVRIK
ncbi:YezD family protein [Alkalihalobacillus sp. 1P02AB]